jgi:peptide chain release factor
MNRWLLISSGRGPRECRRFAALLADFICKQAAQSGLVIESADAVEAEQGCIRSMLLSISGPETETFCRSWTGTLLWVCKSPYRTNHKRSNWFVGVSLLEPPKREPWQTRDLVIQTFRSSGPGGQHVNTTDSAVRVIHQPTGLTAIAREGRSQSANRELALARLAQAFEEREKQAQAKGEQERRNQHDLLERGNPIRTFKGPSFKLVAS